MSPSLEHRMTIMTQNRITRTAFVRCLLLVMICGCQPSAKETPSGDKPAVVTSGGKNSAPKSESSDTSVSTGDKTQPAEPVISQTPNTTPADSAASDSSNSSTTFPGAKLINMKPPFLAAILVDHADHVYREGDKL